MAIWSRDSGSSMLWIGETLPSVCIGGDDDDNERMLVTSSRRPLPAALETCPLTTLDASYDNVRFELARIYGSLVVLLVSKDNVITVAEQGSAADSGDVLEC